jgi:FkbM family methyltransferase
LAAVASFAISTGEKQGIQTMPPSSTKRDDWLLVVAVALVSAMVTYAVASTSMARRAADEDHDDMADFRARYGPTHHSQGPEEWLIRDYFNDKRDGVFLDVGANHYMVHSTTYYLEQQLAWSGVAVEAQSEFGDDYVKHRPRTRFVAMFAGDTEGGAIDFFVPKTTHGLTASAHKEVPGGPVTARRVPTTTLTAVLERAGIAHIDFLSMDIELSEPTALKGFDIDRFQPALVCIEDHQAVRQQILDYFESHAYRLIGKYLRADVNNLYFERKR